MTRADLLAFLQSYRYAVQCSVAHDGAPQAATVGIAVTTEFELVFDTLLSSRKAANLRRDHRIAFVIGSLDDQASRTVQYEGVVDQPTGDELMRLQETYFHVFPEGRERQAWPGLTYFRARATWLRYSDFRTEAGVVLEFTETDLRRLA